MNLEYKILFDYLLVLDEKFCTLNFIYLQVVVEYLIVDCGAFHFKTLNCFHEKLQIFAVFKF